MSADTCSRRLRRGQPRWSAPTRRTPGVAPGAPSFGWVDFDPTNNLVPSLDHITVAWGRDYSDVCPIKGVFVGGGQHSMHVAVEVRPLVATG